MKHFRRWLRWFLDGPDALDAFKREVMDGFADVGRAFFEYEKRIAHLEEEAGAIATISAEVTQVRSAQRQLQDLHQELQKPGVERPRTASQFRQMVEGNNAA